MPAWIIRREQKNGSFVDIEMVTESEYACIEDLQDRIDQCVEVQGERTCGSPFIFTVGR